MPFHETVTYIEKHRNGIFGCIPHGRGALSFLKFRVSSFGLVGIKAAKNAKVAKRFGF